jgi:riboflavin transporter FmnP
MYIEYYVLGAIALVLVILALSMLPDFVRYMKIRSM